MQKTPRRVRLTLSPQAGKYARRDAPREARLLAARGALPLPPAEVATVLFALLHDPDPEVKSCARDSLEGLPAPILEQVLSSKVHPALLAHFAQHFRETERNLERIALNENVDDATLAFMAGLPLRGVVDLISHNQERLQRAPGIVEALGENPLTGRAVIDRILAFVGETQVTKGDHEPKCIDEAQALAALRAVLGEELSLHAEALITESESEEKTAEAAVQDAVVGQHSLPRIISGLSVFQKIKLARMGNREARSLLVRDRNKVVAISAVTNPKVSENELIAIAQSRAVCDEVIRVIAGKREVTRSYPAKLALTTNPKTPQAVAMKFVNYLQDRDLRNLMKSKDVPSAISAHARRVLTKKGRI
ncbi:MAG: hypothetical protein AAEJ53_20830 [Myxococcota bacterium]